MFWCAHPDKIPPCHPSHLAKLWFLLDAFVCYGNLAEMLWNTQVPRSTSHRRPFTRNTLYWRTGLRPLLDELKNPMFNFYNLSRIVFFFVTIVQARVETIHEVLNTLAGEFIDALIVLAQRASCRFNDTPGSLMHSSMAAIRYDWLSLCLQSCLSSTLQGIYEEIRLGRKSHRRIEYCKADHRCTTHQLHFTGTEQWGKQSSVRRVIRPWPLDGRSDRSFTR